MPRVVVRPLQSLMAVETSSAALILVATVAALVVANTPMVNVYEHFWETALALDVGDLHVLHITLHELVNDALMTLFFLLVSLEIKREMVFGELRDPRAAALPIVAAVGGMVVPALIYVAPARLGDPDGYRHRLCRRGAHVPGEQGSHRCPALLADACDRR